MKQSKNRSDLETKLEHYIKAMADPKTHSNPELKKLVQDRIKKLAAELKKYD